MNEPYIHFCVDLETEEGTSFTTIEAKCLVHFETPSYTDDLDFDIVSYWVEVDGKYEALPDGVIRELIKKEDEIYIQVFKELVSQLGLEYRQPEYFGHHEYFGRPM